MPVYRIENPKEPRDSRWGFAWPAGEDWAAVALIACALGFVTVGWVW